MALKKTQGSAELLSTAAVIPAAHTPVAGDPGSEQADIAPATEFNPSGAPQQVVSDVDPSHPAVDADPRANTTVDQNRIDFNDPTISGQEAVERALAKSEADKGE
jgi:hypothetical protein